MDIYYMILLLNEIKFIMLEFRIYLVTFIQNFTFNLKFINFDITVKH